nr:MAG TPA: hypothetical protein [Caudoviricetes sp.]
MSYPHSGIIGTASRKYYKALFSIKWLYSL